MDRFEVLNDLVCFNKPVNVLLKNLSQFDWDYDNEPLVLQTFQVRQVLEGFLSNKYSAKELEGWANLIECREDIDFQESKREEIEEIIDILANPILQGEITHQSCEELLKQLGSEISGVR